VNRRKFPYKTGVVVVENHPILKKGQVVEILESHETHYDVRVYMTGGKLQIKKEEVLTN